MVFIYILELDNKKYYVGKTHNPCFRFEQHFQSNGCSWTIKHKPIRLYELIPDCDDFDEDKYTLKYMNKFGIDNVRGGSYCELKLGKNDLLYLTKRITSATDKCYVCGKSGHFAKHCEQQIISTSDEPIEEPIDEPIDKPIEDMIIKNVFCCKYCNKEFNTLNGSRYHENLYCKNKIISNTSTTIHQTVVTSTSSLATTINNKKVDLNNSSKSESKEIQVYYCKYFNKEFDKLKSATCHENLYCKKKIILYNHALNVVEKGIILMIVMHHNMEKNFNNISY